MKKLTAIAFAAAVALTAAPAVSQDTLAMGQSMLTGALFNALRAEGFSIQTHDGFLEVFAKDETPPLIDVLSSLAGGIETDLFAHSPNLLFEKFHPYLPEALLQRDALASKLDSDGLEELADSILQEHR